MQRLSFEDLRELYRSFLEDDIIPYWFKHGIDREYGGFTNCILDDGTQISDDKYMWSQGRGLWTFSHYYAHFNRSDEVREIIDKTCDFLLRYARNEQGEWAYRLSRTGEHLESSTSIYGDIFAAYGLQEYARATDNQEVSDVAVATMHKIMERIHRPDFTDVAPFELKPGYKLQGVFFLTLSALTPVLEDRPDPELEEAAAWCVHRIVDKHMDPVRKINIEMLDPNDEPADFPQGRDYVPGHGVECAWFMMFEARRKQDDEMLQSALTILRWHLERAWDDEVGGLFWWLNIDGEEPYEKNWSYKLWWPHSEALLACLLGYELSGEAWCMDWYWKIHEYAFKTFPDRENGEWHQRMDRYGKLTTETLVLPVKDPFHMPRAVLFNIEILDRMLARGK